MAPAASPTFVMTIEKRGSLHVLLWLHAGEDPTDAEWNAAIDEIERYLEPLGFPLNDLRSLIVSDGGAPSTVQRARFSSRVQRGQPSTSAVITTALSNPIKRGVATAFSWINPGIKFYGPGQTQQAFEYLGLTGEMLYVWARFRRMQSKMARVETLREMREAADLPPIDPQP